MEFPSEVGDIFYKVDFVVKDLGKRQKGSKKRITWTFRQGSNGPDSTVSFIWSLQTGKQEIELNGEPLWFGRNQGAAVFSHAWYWEDQKLQMEVMATRKAPPQRHVAPDFRCYDLVVNGKLFANFPGLENSPMGGGESVGQDSHALDLPRSIVDILYPERYAWKVSNDDGPERLVPIDSNDVEPEKFDSAESDDVDNPRREGDLLLLD